MANLSKVKAFVSRQIGATLIELKEYWIQGKGFTQCLHQNSESEIYEAITDAISKGATSFAFRIKYEQYEHDTTADFSLKEVQ